MCHLMRECGVVAFGIAEGLEWRHLNVIDGLGIIGTIAAMPDRGHAVGEEFFGAVDAGEGIELWVQPWRNTHTSLAGMPCWRVIALMASSSAFGRRGRNDPDDPRKKPRMSNQDLSSIFKNNKIAI